MKNRYHLKFVFVFGFLSGMVMSCVNPPQRATGVNPNPIRSPASEPQIENPRDTPVITVTPVSTVSGNGDVRGQQGQPPANPLANVSASGTEVSYWLNKTDNSNCLTIQIVGVDGPISSPCPNSEAPKWVESQVAVSSEGFKATIKVDTTDKNQSKYSSGSDGALDLAWRWRCVSKTDPVTKKNVHMVCYEDGNALKKDFESSDLFVRITGPENVDLGGIKCTKVTDFDLSTCSGR